MENVIEYLEWDSNFFGYKIGELKKYNDLEEQLKKAKDEKYVLIYAKNQEAKRHDDYLKAGGKLVDEKVTFLQIIPQLDMFQLDNNIKLYQKQDVSKELLSLALQSGVYSRFKTDTNFKNQEFEKLYAIWIENSIKKMIAKEVIVFELEEKIIGLLTLGIKNNRSDIGILAVDGQSRGLGIGKKLMERAFIESQKLAQTSIQVVTQKSNIEACYFYEKQGFQIEKIENIYHFWL